MKCQLNMRRKNLLLTALVLIVSITMVGAAIWSMSVVPVSAGNAQDIWVSPDSYLTAPELDTLQYCDNFTVTVWINVSAPTPSGGKGLYGWEYHLKWNTTWLSLKKSVAPDITVPPLNFTNGYWVKKNVVTPGDVWCSASAMAPDKPFNQTQPPGQTTPGVTWLSNYTFHVEKSVFEPSPAIVGNITMDLVGLLDEKVADIITPFTDKTVVEYRLCPIPIPPAELGVKPAKTSGVYGKKFNVTIGIEYLNETSNMRSWNATLSYNTTMLDAQASFEGPFLDTFDNASYEYDITEALGTVYMTGFFVDPPTTPPNGTGVLAIVEFNATWQYTVSPTRIPPGVTCMLSLYNTTLVGETAPIDHTVTNATYIAPYKPQVIDHAIVFGGITYHVFTESNSSVSPVPMIFDQPDKSVSFNVTGTSGYWGYCNVTVPKNFLSAAAGAWQIMQDGSALYYLLADNGTHVSLYFKYGFQDTGIMKLTVQVIGTWAVPEFPSALITPFFMVATLVAVILGKKAWSRKRRSLFRCQVEHSYQQSA